MDIAALLASKILLNSIRDTKNRKKKKNEEERRKKKVHMYKTWKKRSSWKNEEFFR
jgi:hypothetical protein